MCIHDNCCGSDYCDNECWSHFYAHHDSVTEVTSPALDNSR